jgi:hypothetical protein
MSKAAAFVAPRRRWRKHAVEGMSMSGDIVATMIMSRSAAARPAIPRALFEASKARSDVD